jgi:hypothetical protein
MKQPIYLGLIYIFIWEGFVASIPGSIGKLTIRHQLQVVGSELTEFGYWASGDWAVSILALLAVTVALVLIGAFVFRQEEVA